VSGNQRSVVALQCKQDLWMRKRKYLLERLIFGCFCERPEIHVCGAVVCGSASRSARSVTRPSKNCAARWNFSAHPPRASSPASCFREAAPRYTSATTEFFPPNTVQPTNQPIPTQPVTSLNGRSCRLPVYIGWRPSFSRTSWNIRRWWRKSRSWSGCRCPIVCGTRRSGGRSS